MAFLPLFTLALGLLGLLNGAFVIWQARGRARAIGVAILVLGVIGVLMFIDGTWGIFNFVKEWGTSVLIEDIKTLIGAVVGALIPIGLLIVALLE